MLQSRRRRARERERKKKIVYVLFAITHGHLSVVIEREGHRARERERAREKEKARNDVWTRRTEKTSTTTEDQVFGENVIALMWRIIASVTLLFSMYILLVYACFFYVNNR